jgi:hypothetical protein
LKSKFVRALALTLAICCESFSQFEDTPLPPLPPQLKVGDGVVPDQADPEAKAAHSNGDAEVSPKRTDARSTFLRSELTQLEDVLKELRTKDPVRASEIERELRGFLSDKTVQTRVLSQQISTRRFVSKFGSSKPGFEFAQQQLDALGTIDVATANRLGNQGRSSNDGLRGGPYRAYTAADHTDIERRGVVAMASNVGSRRTDFCRHH